MCFFTLLEEDQREQLKPVPLGSIARRNGRTVNINEVVLDIYHSPPTVLLM